MKNEKYIFVVVYRYHIASILDRPCGVDDDNYSVLELGQHAVAYHPQSIGLAFSTT